VKEQYYLMSQLPDISAAGEKSSLPITETYYRDLCSRFLDCAQMAVLSQLAWVPPKNVIKTGSAFLDSWYENERCLRYALSQIRAQKLKKESKRRANEILIKAERQADERKDQIVSSAMNNRERMMMKAEADIEKMRQNAKFELQKEVGEMAVELAEKIIKQNINDKQDEIIDNFINEIGD